MSFRMEQFFLLFIGIFFAPIVFVGTKFPETWLDARTTILTPIQEVRVLVYLHARDKNQSRLVHSVPAYTIDPDVPPEELEEVYFFFNVTSGLVERLKEIINYVLINPPFPAGLDPFNYWITFGGVKIYDTKDPLVTRKLFRKIFYVPVPRTGMYNSGKAVLGVHFYPSVVQLHEG